MEPLEKTITKTGRFGTAILTAAIEGSLDAAVDVLLKAFGPEKLALLIDNDWSIIGSIYYNLKGFEPDWGKMNLSEKERAKAEKIRRSEFLRRLVLPALDRVQSLASKFPELVNEKITVEWLMGKGEQKRPVLVKVLRSRGEIGQRWLEKQVELFKLYFTGRLIWSDRHGGFVQVVPAQPRGSSAPS